MAAAEFQGGRSLPPPHLRAGSVSRTPQGPAGLRTLPARSVAMPACPLVALIPNVPPGLGKDVPELLDRFLPKGV